MKKPISLSFLKPNKKLLKGFCELVLHNDQPCGKEASKKFIWTKNGHNWRNPIETYICPEHEKKFRNSLDHMGYYEIEEESFSLREKVTFS